MSTEHRTKTNKTKTTVQKIKKIWNTDHTLKPEVNRGARDEWAVPVTI